MKITSDESDRKRFVRSLFYMNDEYVDANWLKVGQSDPFFRSISWPKREPLVRILCYTLMPNHLHLLLREIKDGGISRFMQKIGQSMTNAFNEKYGEKVSIFQGSYKGRTVHDDKQLQYTAAYIMVKNTFELYPEGGLGGAVDDFEHAWKWAVEYPFSSLREYACADASPVLENNLLWEMLPTIGHFKDFSRDVIISGKWLDSDIE